MQGTRRVWLLLLLVVPAALLGLTYLLTAIFGAPSTGLLCHRGADAPGICQIQRSRLLGFGGSSSVAIPESEIVGAETLRPRSGVGRGSGGYTLSLQLRRGPYRHYPVLSGPFWADTDAQTQRLNAYLRDPGQREFAVRENRAQALLLPLLPLGVVALLLLIASLRGRRLRTVAGG